MIRVNISATVRIRFGVVDRCDGQDNAFPDHLAGGATQGFLGQH